MNALRVLTYAVCLVGALLLSSGLVSAASSPVEASTTGPTPNIQLVAVQMTLSIHDYWTPEAFEHKIRSLMDQVKIKTKPGLPTLVVFPEDVGLMLAVQGMQTKLAKVTTIDGAIQTAVKANFLPVLWTKLTRHLSWVPALFLQRNGLIAHTYFSVFSRMAKEYGVYVVAGSAVLPPYEIKNGEVLWQKGPQQPRVYNTSYLFGPDGKVIGNQRKVYLIDLEAKAALDLAQGRIEDLQVYDTALGKVGIGICLDSFRDDVAKALYTKGAQILVQPTANPGPWNTWQQGDWLTGSYKRTYEQKYFAYAVNPMMNGPLWDIAFFGQSSIVSRNPEKPGSLHYTNMPPALGFVAMARNDNSEEIVVAVVPHP